MLGLFVSLACATTPAPTAGSPEVATGAETPDLALLHVVDAPGVFEARFLGETVPTGIEPAFGVRALDFRFPDEAVHRFTPTGSLYHSDWSFDILSPDGRWVALAQDHYGPFHIIDTHRLRDYLEGAPADHVVAQTPLEGGAAWVHGSPSWTDAQTFSYRAGLTTTESFSFALP